MTSSYYDRQGNPITLTELGNFPSDYKRVARDEGETYEVSTVWLGLDHSYGGAPIIFETMVFGNAHPLDQHQVRYATEAEALAGHAKMVTRCEEASRMYAAALESAEKQLPLLIKHQVADILCANLTEQPVD